MPSGAADKGGQSACRGTDHRGHFLRWNLNATKWPCGNTAETSSSEETQAGNMFVSCMWASLQSPGLLSDKHWGLQAWPQLERPWQGHRGAPFYQCIPAQGTLAALHTWLKEVGIMPCFCITRPCARHRRAMVPEWKGCRHSLPGDYSYMGSSKLKRSKYNTMLFRDYKQGAMGS